MSLRASSIAWSPSTVAEALASTMQDIGVSNLFTLMGANNIRIIHHLAADFGVRVHHLRHENAAVAAADGWARRSSEVGWCALANGPGLTNGITSLITAVKARVPLVILTADAGTVTERDSPFAGGVQRLDAQALCGVTGARYVKALQGTRGADLIAARDMALESEIPVVYSLSLGFDGHSPSATDEMPTARPRPPATPATPPTDLVREAVDRLRAASRIVIVAGHGAVAADAIDAVEGLAADLDCWIATSLKAVGSLRDSASNLGIFGGFLAPDAADAVLSADCVLVVGAGMNALQTRRSALLAEAYVIRVDCNARVLEEDTDSDLKLLGDARSVLGLLRSELGLSATDPGPPSWSRRALGPAYESVTRVNSLDPRDVATRLDEVLPVDRTVVVDCGHFSYFPIMYMTHRAPERVLWMAEFGAVGNGLGAAIGASCASPAGSTTVLFVGDGGLYMTIGDIETAVREKIGLVVACMNDGASGSEIQHMTDWGVPTDQAIFGVGDIGAAARGLGAHGVTISNLDDIAGAVGSWNGGAPLVLDIRISRDVRSPLYDHS